MSSTIRFDNKHAARAHLVMSLINNRLLEADIDEDISIAEGCCNDLYLAFDNDLPIEPAKNNWDLDYFYKQIGLVEMTFSKERLAHILKVRKYLREKGVPELQYISTHNHVTDAGLEEKKFYNEPETIKPKLKQPLASRRISDSSTRKYKQQEELKCKLKIR